MKYFFIVPLLLCSLLTGCLSTDVEPPRMVIGGTGSLSQLQQLRTVVIQGKSKQSHVSQIRYDALKETALSIGARSALAWRANTINAELAEQEKILDQTYNFYGLLIANDILPPVLAQGDDTLNLASPDTLRIADRVFKIVSQARFVTAPPTWRDYIWLNYPQPDVPERSLLPQNRTEQKIWQYYVTQGWQQGIEQATNIFAADLARLNRDYSGMVLYHRLYEQNMVSAPFVARTDLGITGNASHIRIDDRILRITALPQLNLQSAHWKPIIVKNAQVKTPAVISKIMNENQDEQVIRVK